MTDARHDELLDHGFGSRERDTDPGVIAMGPARDDIQVDDIEVIDDIDVVDDTEVIAMGPVPEAPRPSMPRSMADPEVPAADAWEQARPADPDEPAPPAPRSVADPEVPTVDAWEQSQPTDRFDDY
jgi:hypothetical protein